MASRVVVCQQSTPYLKEGKPTDLWHWSMWIEPAAGHTLQSVKRVVYSLHPAFPNPNRVIRNTDGGFRLDVKSNTALGQTWGSFRVRVRVVSSGGEVERHDVALQLGKRGQGVPAL